MRLHRTAQPRHVSFLTRIVSDIAMPLRVSGPSIQEPTDQFLVGTSPSIIFSSMLAAVPKALIALHKMFSSIWGSDGVLPEVLETLGVRVLGLLVAPGGDSLEVF